MIQNTQEFSKLVVPMPVAAHSRQNHRTRECLGDQEKNIPPATQAMNYSKIFFESIDVEIKFQLNGVSVSNF